MKLINQQEKFRDPDGQIWLHNGVQGKFQGKNYGQENPSGRKSMRHLEEIYFPRGKY